MGQRRHGGTEGEWSDVKMGQHQQAQIFSDQRKCDEPVWKLIHSVVRDGVDRFVGVRAFARLVPRPLDTED